MSTVELAVYDLSRGMALMMSQQILGQQIEGIWHTGVVVFGIEYYFGGGIQKTPFGIFSAQNQMQCQKVTIGTTQKTRSDLDAYLASISRQFSMTTYDLINNNCNNFSDVVCRFLTGNGIPSHIINLPATVFSTPGGMMLRPMIENMQRNIMQNNNNNSFENVTPQQFETNISNNVVSTLYSALNNNNNNNDEKEKEINNSNNIEHMKEVKKIIDSVITSSEAGNIDNIIEKIIKFNYNKDNVSSSYSLNEEDKEVLRELAKYINKHLNFKSGEKELTLNDFPVNSLNILSQIFVNYPSLHLSILFLIRFITILPLPLSQELMSFIEILLLKLLSTEINEKFSSTAIKSMAISTLINLSSHKFGQQYLILNDENRFNDVLEMCLNGMNNNENELMLRLMHSALAHNITLACTKENNLKKNIGDNKGEFVNNENDLKNEMIPIWHHSLNENNEPPINVVQILCGIIELICSENNNVIRLRKLSMASRIIENCGPNIKSLGLDLGFLEIVNFLLSDESSETKINQQEKCVLLHLKQLLS